MACVDGFLSDLTSRSHLRFNDGPLPFNFGETNLGMISLHFSSDHFSKYGFLVTNFLQPFSLRPFPFPYYND
jgi:hypothetical protein